MTYVKDFFGPNVLINESEKIERKVRENCYSSAQVFVCRRGGKLKNCGGKDDERL